MRDEPVDNIVFGPAKNVSNLDFQEVEEIIKNMSEKNKMDEKTHEVAPHESWLLPTSEACEIPTHPNFNPNQWITPQFVSPAVLTTKYVEFIAWLKGMCKAYHDMDNDTIPIEDIKNKLEDLEL